MMRRIKSGTREDQSNREEKHGFDAGGERNLDEDAGDTTRTMRKKSKAISLWRCQIRVRYIRQADTF